jgi:glycosyltransferase involved in cell wall biosynthesis
MEIKGIKYIAPCLDQSGYARASRGNILALHSLGIPVTVSPISFEKIHPDLNEHGRIIASLVNKDIDYNIVIIHSTPEFWEQHKEAGKTMVGYTIWETTKLHPDWIGYINNNVEKVLVGSKWNVEVFKKNGIKIPVGVVPHGVDVNDYRGIKPYAIKGVSDDTFVFYDIFQWTERKHPLALIKAYWYAFQNPEEKVALVMKTHRSSYTEGEKDAIRSTVKRLKEVTPIDHYPPIYLILDMLSEDEMAGLHARGDCYASLDRGEGFGLGPFQAAAAGNPIIVTGFGGVTEYAKDTNSYLVDYVLTPVFGMPWSPWYRGDQLWAEPSVLGGADALRRVYENRDEAKDKAKKLQGSISRRFSWNAIGKKIVKELEKL